MQKLGNEDDFSLTLLIHDGFFRTTIPLHAVVGFSYLRWKYPYRFFYLAFSDRRPNEKKKRRRKSIRRICLLYSSKKASAENWMSALNAAEEKSRRRREYTTDGLRTTGEVY